MAPRGAVLMVPSFTDRTVEPSFSFTGNERSRIARNFRDLCGIIATGEILSSDGGLCFMSSHTTTRAWPFLIFLSTSCQSCALAVGSSDETCGPLSIAACIISSVQGRPVCVGQPRVAATTCYYLSCRRPLQQQNECWAWPELELICPSPQKK